MFGMGWTEILLIGVVALIVVGPKELPNLFRTVGQVVGKARGMAREFSRAMEDAADQSGMRETSDMLKGLNNPKKFGLDKVREAADSVTNWKPDSNTGKLSEERAEAAQKIQEATAKAATARQQEDAAEAAQAEAVEAQAEAVEALAVPEIGSPRDHVSTPAMQAADPDLRSAEPAAQPGLRQTAAQRANGLRAAKTARGAAGGARSSRLPSRKK